MKMGAELTVWCPKEPSHLVYFGKGHLSHLRLQIRKRYQGDDVESSLDTSAISNASDTQINIPPETNRHIFFPCP